MPYASARPRYMEAYNNHPAALDRYINDCSICHFDPNGGGARTDFGEAFVRNRKKINGQLAFRREALKFFRRIK